MSRVLAAVSLLLFAACGPSGGPCRVDADCASGLCSAAGECIDPAADGGSDEDGGTRSDGGSTDGGSGSDGGNDGGTACVPDADGRIDADEAPFRVGLSATFRVASDVDLDTTGAFETGGERVWDLTSTLPGDHDVEVTLEPPDGAWFEDAFPTATYHAPLRDGQSLLGVFERAADELLLLGVVSETGGLTRTELEYDPPVVVLRYPLELGATWRTDASVTGLAGGVLAAYTETYESRVDAAGTLRAPFGDFPVLRVRTDALRTVGLMETPYSTFAFGAECYGTVATIASDDGDSGVELSHVAEVRRLAP